MVNQLDLVNVKDMNQNQTFFKNNKIKISNLNYIQIMSFRSRRQVIINEPENELNLNSNNDEKPSNDDEEKENNIKPVDVPPKSLYGNNLKKIKSFKKLRRGYKLQNQRAIFINDLKQLLKQFPAENHQYDDELLIEILNIAESFFIYGSSEQRENIKTEFIEELMKPF